MPIQFKLEGATPAQKQRVADAFVGTQGPIPTDEAGNPTMTVAEFVNRAYIRFTRAVVKGWERSQKEAEIQTLQESVDAEFPEE